ncbi:13398_t:CDS:2, partial [Acaulospora morrowiae]
CFAPNPRNPKQLHPVDCDLVTESKSTSNLDSNQTSKFDIKLKCDASDTICKKVNISFQNASAIISSYLILDVPIVLNASFVSFCGSNPKCPESGILGLGAPTRWLLMQDDDSAQRLYPQALVKQFQLNKHLTYDQFDIFVSFNSDKSFWFQGDPPMRSDQYDFLYLMLHEIHHGLGFSSAWDTYYDYRILTPLPAIDPINGGGYGLYTKDPGNNDKIKFYELAFDKYMILLSNGTKTSTITNKINEFFIGGSKTLSDFYDDFPHSPQYRIARDMYQRATTAKTLGFLPQNTSNISQAVILETSFYPYRVGSSISHVDGVTYTNTSDFLMKAFATNGKTLAQIISIGGNYTLGPIGPKLKQVMETLGYKTSDNLNPYVPRIVENGTTSSFSGRTFKPWDLKFRMVLVIMIILFVYKS